MEDNNATNNAESRSATSPLPSLIANNHPPSTTASIAPGSSASTGPSLHVSLPPNFPEPVETSFSPPSSKNGIGAGTASSSIKQLLSPNVVATTSTNSTTRPSPPPATASSARGETQFRSPFSLQPSNSVYNPNAPFSPPETYTYSRKQATRDSPGTKSAKSTPGRSMSMHTDPHQELFHAEFRDPHRADFDLSLPPSLLSSGRKASVSLHLFKETSSKPSGTGIRDKPSSSDESKLRESRKSSRPPPSQRNRSQRAELAYLSEQDDAGPIDLSLPPGLLSPPDSELGLARPATPSSLLQHGDLRYKRSSVDLDSASAASAPSGLRSHFPDVPEAELERRPKTVASPEMLAANLRAQTRKDSPEKLHEPLPIPISRDAVSRRHDQLDGQNGVALGSAVASSAAPTSTSTFQRHSSVPETDRTNTGWSDRLKMTRRQSVDEIVQSASEFEDDDFNSIGSQNDEGSDEDDTHSHDDAGSSNFDPDAADEDDLHMSGSEWEPHDDTADVASTRSGSAAAPRPPTVVQLQPYNNQVGGHNSIFQFSKRAVCKPLVGRENEFYEAVEREHPRLLAFIPQYLGVLNVTYRHNEEHNVTTPAFHRSASEDNARKERAALAAKAAEVTVAKKPDLDRTKSEVATRPQRKVFEGQEDWGRDIPEVSLDLNRHIAPSWMLRKCRLPLTSSGVASGRASHCSTPGRSRASSHARTDTISSDQTQPNPTDSTVKPAGRLTTSASAVALLEQGSKSHLDPTRDSKRGSTSHSPSPIGSPDPGSKYSKSISSSAEWSGRHASLETPGSASTLRARSPALGSLSMTSRTPSQSSHYSPSNPNCIHGRGFTTVNQRLQEQVLREVFSSPLLKNSLDSRYESNAKQTARKNRRRLAKAWEESEEGERLRLTRNLGPLKADMTASPLAHASDAGQSGRNSVASGVFPTASSTPVIYRGDARHPSTPPRTPPLAPSSTRPMVAAPSAKAVDAETDASQQMEELNAGLHRAKLEDSTPNDHDTGADTAHLPAEEASQTRQFLLMEDLTGRLKSPCVLDLKMGTRQYGLDATDVKKRSQTKKCDKTTSRSHGVRICGMQVYNCIKEDYLFQDKYYGRKVSPADFPTALGNFFSNGSHILVHHVPLILQKIYHLARIVWHLRGYRFYASSLLFIYDGDCHTQQKLEEEFDQRCAQGHGGKVPYSPSVSTWRAEAEDEAVPEDGEGRQSYSIGSSPLLGPVGDTGLRRRRRRGEINIRIIDFAHCTTGHDYDFGPERQESEEQHEDALPIARFPPKLVDGPDSGYLFGLKNLAASFEEIWSTERERRRRCRTDLSRASGTDEDQVQQDTHGKCIADLGSLEVEGRQVFDDIFGNGSHGLDGYVSS